MHTGKAQYLFLILVAALAGPAMVSSCTNDLKKIKEISDLQKKTEKDSTKGVNALVSDSGHIKARITGPLMLEYELSSTVPDAYRFFPKGIKIVMFDQFQKEKGNIVADTGYYYEGRNMVKFIKNVVITTIKGDVFKSDELVWDGGTHKIYSNKPVDFSMADGSKAHGTAMDTNEAFYPFNLQNFTGSAFIERTFGQ